jgi:formylglycine-generating enzyme required for sulfatase activity
VASGPTPETRDAGRASSALDGGPSPTALALRDPMPAMVAVPGGRFRMGCDTGRDDERPARSVWVGPFALARTPVTRAQYAAFRRATSAPAPPWWDDAAFAHPDHPVVGVTWYEAAAYAGWASRAFGGTWRLPTEAEWERAARGGIEDAATAWGDVLPAGEVPDGPLAGPWLAYRGTPNGFGLGDMGTIVHEWCADWYEVGPPSSVPPSPSVSPLRAVSPLRRASRGGSWRHRVRWSSPSARSSLPPSFRYADYGFRVLREVG